MNDPVLDVLLRSPFFEPFALDDLNYLARHARAETYRQDDLLLTEGDPAHVLFLLLSGAVRLSFQAQVAGDGQEPAVAEIPVRDVADAGYPVGWSVLVAPYRYNASAIALRQTRVLAFDKDVLERRSLASPEFGVRLMERILWMVGRRLRETRIRLVARRYQEEVVAIRALLDQNAERLRTDSPLHKIPYYLEHRLTLSDAFDTLRLMRTSGEERERDLASLCLDILSDLRTEMEVFRRLQGIYELVSHAPAGLTPEQVNDLTGKHFSELFARTRYRIEGAGNLPSGSGHIFIMNHVCGHREYILPNGFLLLFDTNFVSTMIVRERYGAAPIRVVRESFSNEFGHKSFYDHGNYILVRGDRAAEPAERSRQRQDFYDRAGAALRSGNNIILCPEGTCGRTEQSPKPFKTGAFQLAAQTRPEPLIVPIAVANFDKKLSRATLVAVVHEPFRVSDRISLPADEPAFRALAGSLRDQYRSWVQEAMLLSAEGAEPGAKPPEAAKDW